MNKYQCNKCMKCTSTVNKLFDYNKTLIELNSNFPIKFTSSNCSFLPGDSKIEILESKLHYNVCKVEKDILINGHHIVSNISTLKDCFRFKDEYINLPEGDYKKILLNITECIKLKVSITVEIKAISHTNSCEDIYIEAFGESEDCIETILMTNTCIPNCKCILEKSYINLENSLIAVIDPNYIFLSPIYDCFSNIDSFLGKIFINYGVILNSSSFMPINKLPCEYNPEDNNLIYKQSTNFN